MDGQWEDKWLTIPEKIGKYTKNYFTYEDGCMCMFNDWLSSLAPICPDNYNYFSFWLKGGNWTVKEHWEVKLFGDGTIEV